MQRKSFTLIELLVVVAIIAVLVAILLPALTQARDHAKEVTCLSNLRQWAIILAAYENDYQDFLPRDWPRWETVLENFKYLRDRKITVCPNFRRLFDKANASYVPNGFLWGSPAPGCLNGNTRGVQADPVYGIMMAEREHEFGGFSAAYGQCPWADNYDVALGHRGSGDFLFLDGHALWMERTGWGEARPGGSFPDPELYDLFRRHWRINFSADVP